MLPIAVLHLSTEPTRTFRTIQVQAGMKRRAQASSHSETCVIPRTEVRRPHLRLEVLGGEAVPKLGTLYHCRQRGGGLGISCTCACRKLAVRRLMPMPSVMVSHGCRSRVPSASSCANATPRVTALNRLEPGGSISTICAASLNQ